MPHKCPEKRRRYNLEYKKKNAHRLIPLEVVRNKKKKKEIRKYIENIRSSESCKKCGENTDCCLDFHHVNPEDKKFEIAVAAAKGVSLKTLNAELDKCIILCANCHRKLHAGIV